MQSVMLLSIARIIEVLEMGASEESVCMYVLMYITVPRILSTARVPANLMRLQVQRNFSIMAHFHPIIIDATTLYNV